MVIPLCLSPTPFLPPCSTTALLAQTPASLIVSHPMYTGHLTVPPNAIRSRAQKSCLARVDKGRQSIWYVYCTSRFCIKLGIGWDYAYGICLWVYLHSSASPSSPSSPSSSFPPPPVYTQCSHHLLTHCSKYRVSQSKEIVLDSRSSLIGLATDYNRHFVMNNISVAALCIVIQ